MDEKLGLDIGDMVTRISYNNDILFKIVEFTKNESGQLIAKLKGIDVRLLADSPLDDLVRAEKQQVGEYRKNFIKRNNDCLKKIFNARARQHVNAIQAKDNQSGDFF